MIHTHVCRGGRFLNTSFIRENTPIHIIVIYIYIYIKNISCTHLPIIGYYSKVVCTFQIVIVYLIAYICDVNIISFAKTFPQEFSI